MGKSSAVCEKWKYSSRKRLNRKKIWMQK